jgi:hypothetical protein
MNNWMIEELIAEQRLRRAEAVDLDLFEEARLAAPKQPGLRHALATGLVRLGTALDHDAGVRIEPARRGERWEDGHGVYS